LAARLMGSSDIFENFRRKTWASINFAACHDGFTLHDLTAYAERHNAANRENNLDGTAENFSANHGAEGPTDDPKIIALREAKARAMLATLFFSHGTPMLLAGDEFGHTQQGNNNAYCQDNEVSWLDWPEMPHPLFAFTCRLTASRARHPSLRAGNFLHGTSEVLPGIEDVAWFDENALPIADHAWGDPAAQHFMLRRGVLNGTTADITLAVFNGSDTPRDFSLPNPELPWEIILDSANPENDVVLPADSKLHASAHSVILLAATVPV